MLGLTDKQRRFCEAYVHAVDGSAGRAAMKAGYSKKVAYVVGTRNLQNPKVQAEISRLQQELAAAFSIEIGRVALEIARLSFNDPRKAFNEDQSLKNITDWPDELAAAVSSIEIEEINLDGDTIGHIKKIKFWDKNSALDKAAKIKGMYEKDNRQKNDRVHSFANSEEVHLALLQLRADRDAVGT